ncbi:hypothetical protein CPT_Moby_084 [Stenotrophomonas phage Moby]|uniref:Uncharacterized protein n=1 Tax=Stenotrophomonas phage Moby TaxID=2601680 RepID=A0A5P8PMC5_9CAUD|nr:hypothetical protein HWC58_gp084 [Stenotrophomonas phage Moby]QFR57832.1 hypothetical protein CPT_Moby_084 [Stenotrophomonas phage Moby]
MNSAWTAVSSESRLKRPKTPTRIHSTNWRSPKPTKSWATAN